MNYYLDGYRRGATIVGTDRKNLGWARAKGWLKKLITNTLKYNETAHVPQPWSAGYIDALLDSIN